MLKEARAFGKALSGFEGAVKKFSGASGSAASVCWCHVFIYIAHQTR